MDYDSLVFYKKNNYTSSYGHDICNVCNKLNIDATKLKNMAIPSGLLCLSNVCEKDNTKKLNLGPIDNDLVDKLYRLALPNVSHKSKKAKIKKNNKPKKNNTRKKK